MSIYMTSIALYLIAAAWLAWNAHVGRSGRLWLLPATLAVLLHGAAHVLAWRHSGTTDMHFFAALSLTGVGMAGLTALGAVTGRMRALGVVVFPLAALLLLGYGLHGHNNQPELLGWQLLLHAWLSLLAYATLALAAVLAMFLWMQERALRRRALHGWLRALPPLTELESLLFRCITAGFVLLTGSLLTGALFVENLFAQHLVHKTVLTVLSWLVFGGLLMGRRLRGWRGATAVRWTLSAMALLLLGYFGSKFVLELILHRAV